MHVLDRKQAFTSPEAVFPFPRAVLYTDALTDDEKVAVLRNWKRKMMRLCKAAGGSTLHCGSSDVGLRLQDVEAAIIELTRVQHA